MTHKQAIRGFIASVDVIPPLVMTFQFNPEKIDDNKTVNYGDRDSELCGSGPNKMYTGGGDRTISFTIQLHGMERGSNALNPTPIDNGISTELAKLRSFLYPREDAWAVLVEENGKRLSSPPKCVFGFGAKILDCWVTNVQISETQFNSALAPVRAEATITLIVNEERGNGLFELDKQRRNTLAALGIQNISSN